jgi:hypothetical protein
MLQLHVHPHDDFYLVGFSGLVSVEAWDKVLGELGDAVRAAGKDRVVVNLMGLVGWLGVPERTNVGALMAKHLAGTKKVAFFIQKEKIVGVVEAEARRLGLDVRILPSYEEAVTWVLSA